MEPQAPAVPPPLERLPLHILEYICQYLGIRSLFALSLASRPCYVATTPQRFARLKFVIRTRAKLQHDLQQCITILGRGDRYRHVRRVVVAGSMSDVDEPAAGARGRNMSWPRMEDEWNLDSDDDGDDDDDFKSVHFTASEPALTPQHKQAQHDAWLPFAHFLARLPALADFFYACAHQMPACVLQVLHTHHPKSRLHMVTFSLRSLYRHPDRELDPIDPDEFLLATSPCLCSIRMPYQAEAQDGRRLNLNLEAVEGMVCGWAPKLSRVSLGFDTAPPPAVSSTRRAPGGPWEAILRPGPSQQPVLPAASPSCPKSQLELPRASLDTLILTGCRPRPDLLQTWGSLIDFGALRRFGIHHCVEPPVFAELASLAAAGAFRSLRELHLSVFVDSDTDNATALVDGPVSRFLQAVPPLGVLQLRGYFGKATLEAALGRHGRAVRKLAQVPCGPWDDDMIRDGNAGFLFGPEHIREFELRCPGLEEVWFRLPRSGGGPEEVAMYRALGRLPRLRRLRLVFDCCPPVSEGAAESRADKICRVLTNTAVDGTLARTIFNEIAATSDAPLEHLWLEMDTQDASDLAGESDRSLARLLDWVGQYVVCLRDAPGGALKVREVGVDSDWMKSMRDDLEGQTTAECRDAWNRLWPRRNGDWRDDWKSFPLAGER